MKILKSALLVFTLLITLMSCKNDEENPAPQNEEELITTMILNFVKAGTTDTTKVVFSDPDGDGPMQPSIDDISLTKGTVYDLSIELLNESDPDNVENMTSELEEEGDEHQIFFTITPSGLATHTYADIDINQLPIGLLNKFTTSSTPGAGSLMITLKHQPGLKTSSSTITTGETDIEQTFTLEVID